MPLQERVQANVTGVDTKGWIEAKFTWRGNEYSYKFLPRRLQIEPYSTGEILELLINEGVNGKEPVVADLKRSMRN